MKTREQALNAARRIASEELAILATLTPMEVGARAYKPGGPSVEEIAARFARIQPRLTA